LDRLHLRVEPEDERNLVHWPEHPKTFRCVVNFARIGSICFLITAWTMLLK
jgi:hypothetical protein